VTEVQEFGPPFAGLLASVDQWLTDPVELAIILCLIGLMPVLVVRAMQRPNPLAWGALGFVVLAVFLTRQVWWNFFDISRAITPIMTASTVMALTAPRRRPDCAVSPS